MYFTGGGSLQAIARRLDADGATLLPGGAAVIGSPANYSIVFDYVNTDLTNYINSSQTAQDTNFSTTGNTSATNAVAVALGGEAAAGADITGDIYEVVVYSRALSSGERASVEDWLTSNTTESFSFWIRQNMTLR